MTLCKSIFAYALPSMALLAVAQAQEPQIQQSRQYQAAHAESSPASPPGTPSSQPLGSVRDDDSFGVQRLLQEQERPQYFYGYAALSAFVTNNVALTRDQQHSDSFEIATFGFEYRRPLPHGFQIEVGCDFAMFRYNEFRQLNFNSFDTGIGLSYHTEKLGGLDFFLRYDFNELFSIANLEEFFKNHTLALGGQKTVVFSKAHYAYVGLSALTGFSAPKDAQRSEFAAFAGYHLQVTRHLGADLLYRPAYYLYAEDDRKDWNQTVSLAISYKFCETASLTASSYAAWNRSNQDVFNYGVGNVGGALSLSVRF